MRATQPIRRLIVHHSASTLNTTVRMIRSWHVHERGWADIGYHFIVLADGRIEQGRPLPYRGAHARGANHDSIGICLVGNNPQPDNSWTPEQVESLRRFWDAAQVLYPGIELYGHRDVASGTECPGLDVRELILGESPMVITT